MPTIIIIISSPHPECPSGVSVMNLRSLPDLDDALAKWKLAHPGKYLSHREGADADRQTERVFRDALGSDLTVDMPRARDIHRDRLRVLRAPKFEPLERAQRTALVQGNQLEASRLETELQKLRDATADPRIDSAQTPEELKAVMPAVLR